MPVAARHAAASAGLSPAVPQERCCEAVVILAAARRGARLRCLARTGPSFLAHGQSRGVLWLRRAEPYPRRQLLRRRTRRPPCYWEGRFLVLRPDPAPRPEMRPRPEPAGAGLSAAGSASAWA